LRLAELGLGLAYAFEPMVVEQLRVGRLSLLLGRDDLATEAPVGVHHRGVDGAGDAGAGLVEDRGNALVQALLGSVGQLGHRRRKHGPAERAGERSRTAPTQRSPGNRRQ
jgi:hypothetical protein